MPRGHTPSLFDAPGAPEAPRLAAWAPDDWPVADDWRPCLDAFWPSPAGQRLAVRLRERLAAGATVYPPQPLRALALTPLHAVRVVVLGQDPYHGPGQAEGLAFSVAPGVRPPPSLRNLFKELARDPALAPHPPFAGRSGSLAGWAGQGVLLLNTTLTVEAGAAASHAGWGWEALTDRLIAACNAEARPKAFLLWGAHAQGKAGLIDADRHLVLRANHPSPLSALRPPQPFIGCGHFGAVNRWLAEKHEKTVDWFVDFQKTVA
ncbi:uracil-DNA glycosylase [Aquabacterium sp. A08]|uniref:uracil-DNA glycosylase n=1 Tax=Aquabacterium sp. A08 TaxID=2718532 RepID=UPI0035301982